MVTKSLKIHGKTKSLKDVSHSPSKLAKMFIVLSPSSARQSILKSQLLAQIKTFFSSMNSTKGKFSCQSKKKNISHLMKVIHGVIDHKTETDSLQLENPAFTIYKSQVEFMSL